MFACVFGGAMVGMFLRVALPEQHQTADSKDVLKLLIGLIETMTALVIGLRQRVRTPRVALTSHRCLPA
jgi:hypothetical protein